MSTIRFKILLAVATLMLMAGSSSHSACMIYDTEGQNYIKPEVVKKTGKMQTTIGYIKDVKPCNPAVTLRPEDSPQKAKCLRSALSFCDPETEGIRLWRNPTTTPPHPKTCEYYKEKSGQLPDLGETYYSAPIVYENYKVGKDGVVRCGTTE